MATIHGCKFPLCRAPFPMLPPPSSGVQAVLCHLSPQPCCRSSRWLGACQLLRDPSLSCMRARAMEKVLPGCFQGFWQMGLHPPEVSSAVMGDRARGFGQVNRQG